MTIGVFDSGFGGLTVLRALLPLIPAAHYIYLGDTARLPYGSKSRETIARYAVSSAKFLHNQGAELLVVACNTATALSLEDIQQALPIPVIGVIQPGAEAALAASNRNIAPPSTAKTPHSTPASRRSLNNNHVLVLATAATVQSRAYTQALTTLGLAASEKACPLLVPLVEEGWIDHPVTDEVLRIYLLEALAEAPKASALLLGCTHYPLLKPVIETVLRKLHHSMRIIDSAHATANATANLVAARFPNITPAGESTCTFYATDSIEKFQRLGSNFLGQPVTKVHLIDLGG
jgi:glutamate racemase